jgi:ribosome biogenesis GTPase
MPVHVLNPRRNEGLDGVAVHLGRGRTGALLGSSGVGKSTIINRLVGQDVQRTHEVRDDDSKGRHTTTRRELVALPNGGLLIDTPGMRELQLWEADDAAGDAFADVEALAAGCHFADCRHRDEPRCAVKAAVDAGALGADRLRSYLTLHAELAHLARQQDERLLLERKRASRVLDKALKQRLRQKGR